MVQIFEKALIAVAMLAFSSLFLGLVHSTIEKLESGVAVESSEFIASKLVEASYNAAILGKVEVALHSSVKTNITFFGKELTVSIGNYTVTKKLPVNTLYFSKSFLGEVVLILETHNGVMNVVVRNG